MSELLLDSSEMRPVRAAAYGRPAQRSLVRPFLISGACAAVLAGFGVAASTVMADLISPSALTRGPAIDTGAAAAWPDLKDGLPALAGTPVKVTTSGGPAAAPATAATPRMASLLAPSAMPDTPKPTQAAVVPPPRAGQALTPAERIPVATAVSVLPPPPPAKIVMPGRLASALPPRPSDAVRAREETVRAQEAASKPREVVAKPHVEARAEPRTEPRTHEAAAPKPAASRPPVAVATATDKAQKAVAARKPVAAPHPTKTTVAEAEPEETEILGVKLPSFAPAGRKIKDSVSALGDAVRNAF